MSDKVFFDTTILIYAVSEGYARTSTPNAPHSPSSNSIRVAYTFVYAIGMSEVNLCKKQLKSS